MPISKTDIINAGLFTIGSKKIFSPTDNTKSARLAESIYEFCRGVIYGLPYDWVFSTTRSDQLAQLANPVTGPDHQYALPDNCVRPIAMVDESGDEIQYPIQQGLLIETVGDIQQPTKTLQTNLDATFVYIKYIVFIEDEGFYPAWFSQLIALYIALYISEPLKQHTPHYTKVKDMFANALTSAVESNALSNVPVDPHTHRPFDEGNNSLVNAALEGRSCHTDFWSTCGIRI